MATPILSKHRVPGVLGDLLVDVRAGTRQAASPAVIVVHGFKGFKDWGMFPPFCERLAKAGFTAVSLNLSGSGVDDTGMFSLPDRFQRNSFSSEVSDLTALVAALDQGALGVPKPTSVGLVGHSRGGGMAVLLASHAPRISTLVTWSAIATVRRWSDDQMATWRREGVHRVRNTRTGEELLVGMDTLEDVEQNAEGSLDVGAAASRLACPWLLVHGTEDETVDFMEARLLAGAAPLVARVLPIDGAGHTYGAVHPFAGMTPALERVFDESIAFLGAHLD